MQLRAASHRSIEANKQFFIEPAADAHVLLWLHDIQRLLVTGRCITLG
jgi:hypothetical protein